jgi:hypothetical protein
MPKYRAIFEKISKDTIEFESEEYGRQAKITAVRLWGKKNPPILKKFMEDKT